MYKNNLFRWTCQNSVELQILKALDSQFEEKIPTVPKDGATVIGNASHRQDLHRKGFFNRKRQSRGCLQTKPGRSFALFYLKATGYEVQLTYARIRLLHREADNNDAQSIAKVSMFRPRMCSRTCSDNDLYCLWNYQVGGVRCLASSAVSTSFSLS